MEPARASKECAALAKRANEVASAVEEIWTSFVDADAPVVIRHYAAAYETEIPRVNLIELAHALRIRAGVLHLAAGSLARLEASATKAGTTPRPQAHGSQ